MYFARYMIGSYKYNVVIYIPDVPFLGIFTYMRSAKSMATA